MGSNRTTQTQSSTGSTSNTFGQISPLDDPRYAAAVGALGDFQFERDSRIPYVFGRQRQQAHESFADPRGGFSTPQLERAILNASDEDSASAEAQALREENQGFQGMRYAQRYDVAGMTAPRTVQTGGTSTSSGTGTSVQSQSPLNSIIQGGSAIGSALIM